MLTIKKWQLVARVDWLRTMQYAVYGSALLIITLDTLYIP